LIEFVVDKNLPDFSLEQFKLDYNFYCKDLCDEMEQGFIDYLFVFFSDKGMPALATTIQQGSKYRIAYELSGDMKKALNKPLYDEMIENSFYYAPPYLPIYGFIRQTKKWPMLLLTVMEWQNGNIKRSFTEHLNKYYPGVEILQVQAEIEKWLNHLKVS
jgi:hypothetical protein